MFSAFIIRRKPTQKAAENLEALGVKFDNAQVLQSEVQNHATDAVIERQTVSDTSTEIPATSSRIQDATMEAICLGAIPIDSQTMMSDLNDHQTPAPQLAERTVQLDEIECLNITELETFLAQCTDRTSNVQSEEHIEHHTNLNGLQEQSAPTVENLQPSENVVGVNIERSHEAGPEIENSEEAIIRDPKDAKSPTAQSLDPPQDLVTGTSTSVIAARSKKRNRAETNDLENAADREVPLPDTPVAKRIRTSKTDPDPSIEIRRVQVSRLCRTLVLELLGMCSGLAPNVPWTLRRAMVPKWQEAGVKADQLNAKNVRAAIKSLCESGKIKQITFAFRGKSGVMVKMSVIALRGVDATNPAVLDLQRKMTEMEPADYVPAELEAESRRAPSDANRGRYDQEINREASPEAAKEQSTTATEAQTPKKRTHKPPARSRPAKVFKERDDILDQLDSLAADSTTRSPSPDPSISLNTGFLTLRIPRLRELNIPSGYPVMYTLLSAVAWAQTELTPSTTHNPPQRRKPGRKRTARVDPNAHPLTWKPPKLSKFPSCLDEIPNIRISRDQALFTDENDRGFTFFEAEVDTVANWEQKSVDLFDGKCNSLVFINHGINQNFSNSFPELSSTIFKALVKFDHDGEEFEADFPETESWAPFTAALLPEKITTTQAKSGPIGHGKKTKKKSDKRTADLAGLDEDEDHATTNARKRRRRLKGPRRSLHTTRDEDYIESSAKLTSKRQRNGQLLRFMSEEEKYHLIVAVVIVRTLAGGIEKFIDWDIINSILPAQDPQNMKEAWKTMCNRFRADIADMTEGLQYRYVEALATAQVPSVNFDSVYATDWQGIFRWALHNLDKSIVKKVEELPATRGELLRRNDYAFNEVKGTREILGYNFMQTIPKKEETVSGVVFGEPMKVSTIPLVPLGSKLQTEIEESDDELTRAKSWIKAILLTPEASFDSKKIQEKLLTLAATPDEVERLLERAVKSLQRDKLVSRSHGTSKGGPNLRDNSRPNYLGQFELSAKFFEQFDFRRMVTPSMLKRAAKYKLETLDQAFTTGSSIVVPKDTVLDDGEMVAIFNLFAMGMLRIRPGDNVPASRWGLEWQKHGYTTRMIDKTALGFSVILTPLKDTYVRGDPLATTRSTPEARVPRMDIDDVDKRGFIPVWFDINHAFSPNMWETVLGAILGLVSTRPGISVREITRTLWFGVSTREVAAVLEWAEGMGLVARTMGGLGWESREWWWMGLGVGQGWRSENEREEGNDNANEGV